MNIPKLSFCITCMNRLNQIKETLPQNLRDNILFNEKIEFIVVDFATPGLQQWIKSEFEEELRSGYLKYYYTEELRYWHASIAKNTAHLLANNDILVNLDCDNYTGYNGGWFVICQFLKYGMNLVLHQEPATLLMALLGEYRYVKNGLQLLEGMTKTLNRQDIKM